MIDREWWLGHAAMGTLLGIAYLKNIGFFLLLCFGVAGYYIYHKIRHGHFPGDDIKASDRPISWRKVLDVSGPWVVMCLTGMLIVLVVFPYFTRTLQLPPN